MFPRYLYLFIKFMNLSQIYWYIIILEIRKLLLQNFFKILETCVLLVSSVWRINNIWDVVRIITLIKELLNFNVTIRNRTTGRKVRLKNIWRRVIVITMYIQLFDHDSLVLTVSYVFSGFKSSMTLSYVPRFYGI